MADGFDRLPDAVPSEHPAGEDRRAGVTRILRQRSASGDQAADELFPIVYEELRAIAKKRLAAENPGHTLQATALVNEAYLRLAASDLVWTDRAQFFLAAAVAMRRVLIDHARSRGRVKRGGGARRTALGMVDLARSEDLGEILAVTEAIEKLESEDERAGKVVRLRFYAGLSVEETALALGVSDRCVKREWAYARAWLYRALAPGE